MVDTINVKIYKYNNNNKIALERNNSYILISGYENIEISLHMIAVSINLTGSYIIWLAEVDRIDNQNEKWSADKTMINTFREVKGNELIEELKKNGE